MSYNIPMFPFGTLPAPHYQTYPDKTVLGGKGAGLVHMSGLGVPVPPGFIIPCSVCLDFQSAKGSDDFLSDLSKVIETGVEKLRSNGGHQVPPLMSVRSGARVSMPGMMDTILNVGMTPGTMSYWTKTLGERATLDCYRRLMQMFGSVVFEIDMKLFEQALEVTKHEAGVSEDSKLAVADLKALVSRYSNIYAENGKELPGTVTEQVAQAALAVFRSWDNPRAKKYRQINKIPEDWGTAVTVQSMVFGNRNDQSATGVVFTRCPSTGKPGAVGEFLVNAQGEDVVAGIRTPDPIAKLAQWNQAVFTDLMETLTTLENSGKDMQDVEFTVEDGNLYILQTRNGKRSAEAAVRIASDLISEGLISFKEAINRVDMSQLIYLMKDRMDPNYKQGPIAKGIAAGGSVVSGVAVFHADDAVNCKTPCILVRKETDPDDIAGMNAAVGILTATGGLTSHAAVVARGMNKTCVVGLTALDVQDNKAVVDHTTIKAGDIISIDGATGCVYLGAVPMIPGSVTADALRLSYSVQHEDAAVLIEPKGFDLKSVQEAVDVALKASPNGVAAFDMRLCGTGGDAVKALVALGEVKLPASASLLVRADPPASQKYHSRFFNMLGQAPGVIAEAQVDVLQNALSDWPENMRKVTTVVGDIDTATTKYLSSIGFKATTKVTTFEDLLTAKGPIAVDPDTILEVFGSQQAYDTAVKVVADHIGKPFDKAPVATHWYEPFVG